MAELLDRIHAEIRERLAASRAAAQEYERLEAALAALGSPRAAAPAPLGSPGAAAPAPPKRARKPAQPRAPRGANREAVLRALEDRPGASASELAAASGVNRTVLYGLLSRLIEAGEVAKEDLPGGATGYKLLREEPTAFPARPPADRPEPAAAEPHAPAPEPAAPEPQPDAAEGEPAEPAAQLAAPEDADHEKPSLAEAA